MAISKVLKEYQHLFKTTPGITTLAYYVEFLAITNKKLNSKFIRCIKDIMLWSWMALAVFILKKAGDIYLYVDYCE